MKTLSTPLFFFLLSAFSLFGENLSNVSLSHLTIEGRYVHENDSLLMGFPGVTLSASFSGSETIELEAALENGTEAHFNVYLNGTTMGSVRIGSERSVINLANKLDPAKQYTLKLVRRTEAWQGVVRVHGLKGDESLVWGSKPPTSVRKLMFIGDSITCGAAIEISEPYCKEGHINSNAEKSYGYVLSKKLGAAVNLVSYGGKGLVRDWQGLTTEVTAPQFFERALPDDESSVWEHENFVPDCVSICLGTNDFSQSLVEKEIYIQAYVQFCKQIRNAYPNAHILLLSSPMFGEDSEKRVHLEKCIQETVGILKADNFQKITWHSVSYQPGTQFNAHPSAPQHATLAEELYPVVGKLLGWLE